jgi:hypothetical protein
VFDGDLEGLLGVVTQGVVDDVAAAFFERKGEAEEVFLGHLFFPAEGLECFDGAHDFLGCGVEF